VHLDGRRNKTVYWTGTRDVEQAVRDFKPDFIYAFYGLSGWVSRKQNRPLVLSLAGDDILGTPNGRGGITIRSRLAIALSQWAAMQSTVVCVQSDEMRDRLWTSKLRARCHVIPYGVDDSRFNPGDRTAARQRLGLDPGTPLVIFPSTPNEPRKRLDLATAAMRIVTASMPSAELQIVTGVPHDLMVDYYRASDCTLLTSDWEGSPNVVKESLFCGTPVVTTDVGDVRRWISKSRASIIVDRDPAVIAAAIRRILESGAREEPQPFVAGFSVRAVTRQVLELGAAVGR
jgi:glycosyltransferase involved in cell wall biosynthesis